MQVEARKARPWLARAPDRSSFERGATRLGLMRCPVNLLAVDRMGHERASLRRSFGRATGAPQGELLAAKAPLYYRAALRPLWGGLFQHGAPAVPGVLGGLGCNRGHSLHLHSMAGHSRRGGPCPIDLAANGSLGRRSRRNEYCASAERAADDDRPSDRPDDFAAVRPWHFSRRRQHLFADRFSWFRHGPCRPRDGVAEAILALPVPDRGGGYRGWARGMAALATITTSRGRIRIASDQEASWREDSRRVSNGDQVQMIAALAIATGSYQSLRPYFCQDRLFQRA
jgi:hypothetical protein